MVRAARWSLAGLLVLLIVGLSFGLGFAVRMLSDDETPTAVRTVEGPVDGAPDFRVLDEIYGALRDYYIEPDALDPELLRTGAINGLINAVGDTHQVYISEEGKLGFNDDVEGQFDGIGASVDQKNGEFVIVQPYEGSPAKNAGVRAGDALLEIDGESIKGLSQFEVISKIRGKRGTDVRLKVRRVDGSVADLTVTRDRILLPSVKVEVPVDAAGNPAPDIGYVRIQQFTGRTIDELKDYLKEAKTKNHKGMIIDLRNNPGGLLKSVVEVTEQFMPNQTILIEQRRNGKEEVLKGRTGGLATDIPLVVLVNHNSASASEILAGSLRDNKRAVVMGETTFGKGTVNQAINLKDDGGALYVTVGRWLTPKRDLIEGRGIKPDFEVTAADNEDPLGYDNAVMHRAVDYLRKGS